jgi:hypothetical protein
LDTFIVADGWSLGYAAKLAPPKTALSDKSAEYVKTYEQGLSN